MCALCAMHIKRAEFQLHGWSRSFDSLADTPVNEGKLFIFNLKIFLVYPISFPWILMPDHLSSGLLQCMLNGATLQDYSKAKNGQNVEVQTSLLWAWVKDHFVPMWLAHSTHPGRRAYADTVSQGISAGGF